jgi:hypothetical protein
MSAISMRRNGGSSGVVAGSLTARWLLWGLPARLGLAVDGTARVGRGARREPRPERLHSIRGGGLGRSAA